MIETYDIDSVLQQLCTIIADSEKRNSRIGYFASLYYKVTAKVKEGIQKDWFEDGKRMEQFDVMFANRYLDAYNAWKKNQQLRPHGRLPLKHLKVVARLFYNICCLG